MAQKFDTDTQKIVLVEDEDGDERPFAIFAVRDAMNRLEKFHKTGSAPGISEGPDGVRIRMGGERGGIERKVTESGLTRAWMLVSGRG